MSSRLLQSKVREAISAKSRMTLVDFAAFQDHGWSQMCPFPGIASTAVSSRPPRQFQFVGRPVEYREVIRRVLEEAATARKYRGLIITGPSGSGKSCILRAVAVELIGRSPATDRVICFWYFSALLNRIQHVHDALIFAYGRADKPVLDKILGIQHPVALSAFLEERRLGGEFVYLVIDDDENYDVEHKHKDGTLVTFPEITRRSVDRSWLNAFQRSCDFVIKTVSPDTDEAVPKLMQKYEVKADFSEEEYTTFLRDAGSVLGAMLERHPERKSEVEFYAGKHPMSLYYLNKTCDECVRKITGRTSNKRRRRSIGLLNPQTGAEVEYEEPPQVEHPENFLDDKQVWEQVLATFQEVEPFSGIRSFFKNYFGPDEDLHSPESVLRRFVRKDGTFCTKYIEEVYVEAAHERLDERLDERLEPAWSSCDRPS